MENNKTNKQNIIIILLVIIIVAIVGGFIYYYLDSKQSNNEKPNQTENNNNNSDDIIAVNLISHKKEEFKQAQCVPNTSKKTVIQNGYVLTPDYDIDQSKYFRKQSDGTYVATATLENISAIRSEYYLCDYAPYYGDNVIINMTANIGGKNLPITLTGATDAYGLGAVIGDKERLSALGISFYTFNDEYLVVGTGNGTAAPVNTANFYFYDINGNKVFELKEIDVDFENIDKKFTYTQNCSKSYFSGQNATFGELKYDTKNKKFINDTELKSVDQYCDL